MKNKNELNIEKLWDDSKNAQPLFNTSEIEDLIIKNEKKIQPRKLPFYLNGFFLSGVLILAVLGAILLSLETKKETVSLQENSQEIRTNIGLKNTGTPIVAEAEKGTEQPYIEQELIASNQIFSPRPIANVKTRETKELSNGSQENPNSYQEENKQSPNDKQVFWHLKGPNASLFVSGKDTSENFSGKNSAFIQARKDNYKSAWLVQEIDAAPYSGKRVKLSAQIKCRNKGKSAWAGLYFSARGDSNNISRFDNMYDKKNALNKWKLNEIVMDVPLNSNMLSFGLYKVYDGIAWIDDIKIEEVKNDVPLKGADYSEASDTGDNKLNDFFFKNKVVYQKKLINLDFEQYSRNSIIGWQMAKESMDYRFINEMKDPTTGNHIALFQGERLSPLDWNAVFQIVTLKKIKGKRIKLTANIKTQDLSNFASIWLRIDDESGNTTLDNMADRVIKGSTYWKNYEIIMDVPSNAKGMSFGTILQGNGKVWMDDFKFTVLGDIEEFSNLEAKMPQDLDFEK